MTCIIYRYTVTFTNAHVDLYADHDNLKDGDPLYLGGCFRILIVVLVSDDPRLFDGSGELTSCFTLVNLFITN